MNRKPTRVTILAAYLATCAVALVVAFLFVNEDAKTASTDLAGAGEQPALASASRSVAAITPDRGRAGTARDVAPSVQGNENSGAALDVIVVASDSLEPIVSMPVRVLQSGSLTYGPPGTETAVTDNSGKAHFEGLAEGLAQVRLDIGAQATTHIESSRTTVLTMAVGPVVHVRGRVVDTEGVAIPGADVFSCVLGAITRTPPIARSDQNGFFDLPIAKRALTLIARASGFSSSPPVLVSADGILEGEKRAAELRLVCSRGGAAIGGRVTLRGTGVPRATVVVVGECEADTSVTDCVMREGLLVTADENGFYELSGARAGCLAVAARARGLGVVLRLTPAAGGSRGICDLSLEPGGTVVGRISTSAGVGIPDAEVRAVGALPSEISASCPQPQGLLIALWSQLSSVVSRSRVDGSFLIEGLTAGPNVLSVRAPGRNEWNETIHVLPGLSMSKSILLDDQVSVTGSVRLADGAPARRWRVFLEGLPSASAATERHQGATDDRGQFVIPCQDATYLLRVFATDTSSRYPAAILRGVVPGRPYDVAIDDDLTPSAMIVGRVTDPAGRPCRGAEAHLRHVASNIVESVEADITGTFRLGPVPPGLVRLRVNGSDGASLSLTPRQLGKGEQWDVGTLVLRNAGSIGLRVTCAAGMTCDHIAAVVLGTDTLEFRELPNGNARIALMPGRYRVVITSDGAESVERTAEVEAGTDRVLEVMLTPGTPVEFEVAGDAATSQSGDALLRLKDDSRGATLTLTMPASEVGYRPIVVGLSPGDWSCEALLPDGRSRRTRVSIAGGGQRVKARIEF